MLGWWRSERMIVITFPDGTCEEYDLTDSNDTRSYEYKIYNRVRQLKKGEQIIIKGAGE